MSDVGMDGQTLTDNLEPSEIHKSQNEKFELEVVCSVQWMFITKPTDQWEQNHSFKNSDI